MIENLEFNFIGRYALYASTDYEQKLNLKETDDTTIDLSSGWAARMDVRDDSNNLIIRFDSTAGGITLSATDPNITLSATDAETDLTPGRYNYDLRLENTDSEQQIYMRGAYHIIATQTEAI